MNVTIRKAYQADFSQILDLIKEFSIFQKTPWKLTISLEEMEKEKDLFQCYIAESDDNKIVGFASFYFTFYSWSGKGMYLNDLYVTNQYRQHKN